MINVSRKIKQSSKKGQTLLLSLLILATVSATAIGFATLIINLIKGGENIDNSISAFYAAQSGLENSLYKVKTNRQTGVGLDQTVEDLKDLSKTNFTSGNMEIEMDESAIKKVEESRTFSLAKDESEQVDLYDPDNPLGETTITKLWITWDNNPCMYDQWNPGDYWDCYGTGSEWVEISWVGWNQAGDSFENIEKILLSSNALVHYDSCPDEGPLSTRCKVEDLDPNDENIVFYRVRIKALNDKVEDIEVKAMNNANVFVDIPARIHTKTIGKFGRTQQALSASMPWQIPVSGLFDYVIFSEEELRKPPAPY